MKKVTIITGDQATGKTTKAKELVLNKKAVWIDSLRKFHLCDLQTDTEVLVIDGLSAKDLTSFKALITISHLTFRPRFASSVVHRERPEIIATTINLAKKNFTERPYIDFIEL